MWLRWATTTGKPKFPLSETGVFTCLSALQEEFAPPSRAEAFLKAARCMTMALDLYSGQQILKSLRLEGEGMTNMDRKRFAIQAPPIPVEGVIAIEETLMDPEVTTSLRIIAGFALWCIGARLRHSDATRITSEPEIEPAAVQKQGRGKGFLEVQGKITKTSQTKAKRRRIVPMVAHSWGISTEHVDQHG